MPTPKQDTAMQQLIKWLDEFDNSPIKPTYANMREKAWQLLTIERQQIVDAVEWNYKSNMGEVYYNSTFNC